jgi:hypothetical protein
MPMLMDEFLVTVLDSSQEIMLQCPRCQMLLYIEPEKYPLTLAVLWQRAADHACEG